jgi:hypothetical protein
MTKVTITQELVNLYPTLEDQLNKTVDSSVLVRAKSDAKYNKKNKTENTVLDENGVLVPKSSKPKKVKVAKTKKSK